MSQPNAQAKKTNKKQKKLSVSESTTLLRSYVKHDGSWNWIMADPAIKAMNRPKATLKNHVRYTRTKKNKKKGSRGEQHRNKILSCIDSLLKQGASVYRQPLDLDSSTSEEEPDEPELDERESILESFDQKELEGSVCSSDINTPEKFDTWRTEEKNRQHVRRARRRKKVEDRKDLVQALRKATTLQEESRFMSTMHGALMLKLLHDTVHKAEEDKIETRLSALEATQTRILQLVQSGSAADPKL
jgi:hypothetical protein